MPSPGFDTRYVILNPYYPFIVAAPEALTARGSDLNQVVAATIEPLSKGLEDNDIEVRYSAVIGLAEITKQYGHGPAVDLYMSGLRQYKSCDKVSSHRAPLTS
jgi:hypothetical protein